MITWTSDKQFEIGGTRFNLDGRPGNERAPSTDEGFTLVKTRRLIQHYLQLAKTERRDILEIGMFQGGSIVLLDKLFRPRCLVGIELSKTPIGALDRYIAKGAPAIRPYYGTSQDDRVRLSEIIRNEFPDGIDLVVDDASHLYAPSRSAFEICFPHLKPGGLYIIEDWQWSHQPPYQSTSHRWHASPALTNLLFELVVSTATPSPIARLEILADVAIVTKSRAPAAQKLPPLNVGQDRLRGRSLQPI